LLLVVTPWWWWWWCNNTMVVLLLLLSNQKRQQSSQAESLCGDSRVVRLSVSSQAESLCGDSRVVWVFAGWKPMRGLKSCLSEGQFVQMTSCTCNVILNHFTNESTQNYSCSQVVVRAVMSSISLQ
jgi:hypothetical protein